MKYYKGDIVCVWNKNGINKHKYGDFNRIPYVVKSNLIYFVVHRCMYFIVCDEIPIQYVSYVDNKNTSRHLYGYGTERQYSDKLTFEHFYREDSLVLVKRPFKNKIKYIYSCFKEWCKEITGYKQC